MLKDNILDELNGFLHAAVSDAMPVFQSGNEEQIMLLLEKWKRAHAWIKEEASKTAKARNLKRLKEQGVPTCKPGTLLERLPQSKRGKPKPKTKEDKLKETAAGLGIDFNALMALAKETNKGR